MRPGTLEENDILTNEDSFLIVQLMGENKGM